MSTSDTPVAKVSVVKFVQRKEKMVEMMCMMQELVVTVGIPHLAPL